MTAQLGLPLGLVRNADPLTSVKAASRSSAFKASHEARIFSAIVDAGAKGVTYREIAAAVRMEPVAVARRLSGMGERGLIKRVWLGTEDEGEYEARDGMAVWRKT